MLVNHLPFMILLSIQNDVNLSMSQSMTNFKEFPLSRLACDIDLGSSEPRSGPPSPTLNGNTLNTVHMRDKSTTLNRRIRRMKSRSIFNGHFYDLEVWLPF